MKNRKKLNRNGIYPILQVRTSQTMRGKKLNRNGIYPIQKKHEAPALAEQMRMFFACPPPSPPAKAGGYSNVVCKEQNP